MKLFLTLFIFVSAAIHDLSAQVSDAGVFGLKFGSSKQAVIAFMKPKAKVSPLSEPNNLMFEKIKFGSFNDAVLSLRFYKDRLYLTAVIMTPDYGSEIVSNYKRVVSDISKKYGEGDAEETYRFPFEKGDGHEVTAIKSGDADISTKWRVGKNVIISVFISPTGNTVVGYHYMPISIQKVEAEEREALKDY